MSDQSYLYNQSSYQKQIYQELTQFDVYLRYTIDTDMQNIFGVCMDYLALLYAQPDNFELLSVFKNRMILQYNLSNTIHNDLQQNAKSIGYRNFAYVKSVAQQNFKTAFELISRSYQGSQSNDAFKILQDYLNNNLPHFTTIQQKELEQNAVHQQFSEKVVQQLITAMQSVDQQYTNLAKQNAYQNATPEQIYFKAKLRFDSALGKIQTIKVEQRKLIPENYPEGVKKLIGSYYLLCKGQTNTKLEQDFISIISNLREQQSSFATQCLLNFCQYLESKELQQQISDWVRYLNNHGGSYCYPTSQQLTPKDEQQLKQFVKDCSSFIEEYGQKRNLVEIIQILLRYALTVINQKGYASGVNPLLALDLNTRDQVGTYIEKLKSQFKSKFINEFLNDVTYGTLKEYYNLNRDDLRILNEDATSIQKLIA